MDRVMKKRRSLLSYLIPFAVGLGAVIGISAYRGAFHADTMQQAMAAVCDGCFTVGVVLLCIGGLMLTAVGGAFDMLSYGVSLLFGILSKEKRRDKDFYEYSQRLKDKREEKLIPLHLLLPGAVFLAAAAGILVLFRLY